MFAEPYRRSEEEPSILKGARQDLRAQSFATPARVYHPSVARKGLLAQATAPRVLHLYNCRGISTLVAPCRLAGLGTNRFHA
jgi:hypothetical protein